MADSGEQSKNLSALDILIDFA
jgi:amino acid transporter